MKIAKRIENFFDVPMTKMTLENETYYKRFRMTKYLKKSKRS